MLVHLPLFGIDVIAEDAEFVWLRGPSGRMCVNKLLPRVFFETVEDAMQAGAVSVRIHSETDRNELAALEERLAQEAAQSDEAPEEGEQA